MCSKTDIYINKAREKHLDKYDYSKVKYINVRTDIIIICPEHGEFTQKARAHLHGNGCNLCANNTRSKKTLIPWEEQVQQIAEIHKNKYDYSKVIYKGASKKIIVICPEHGEFSICVINHKKGQGCPSCNKNNILYNNKAYTQKEIIDKFISIWGNTYDYSKVKYINCKTKVNILCNIHGQFTKFPLNHFKYGCPKCKKPNEYNELLKKECSKNFIEKANIIHKYKYTYCKSIYITTKTKLIVTCKLHGDFQLTPASHLRGTGCIECYNMVRGFVNFKPFHKYLPIIQNIWRDTYDYSNVIWKGSDSYIIVLCTKHGEFKVIPSKHIRGQGCPKCSNQYSKISIQWLQYLTFKYNIFIQHAANIGEFSIPGTFLKADGYCKQTNTIYEFLGDFWHGNPEIYDLLDLNKKRKVTYLELYNNTIDKKEKIINLGYNYVQIWENNWNKFIKTVKNVQRIWRYYH